MLPSLRVLDISTTYVPLGPALKSLLLRHSGLQHLIIDRTGLNGRENMYTLGQIASSIGATRVKEAHRAWRALLVRKRDIEAVQAASAPTTSTPGGPIEPASRARRTGRSALASEATPAARRRQAAQAEAEAAVASASSAPTLARYRTLPLSFYACPPSPSLLSVCCGTDALARDPDEIDDCTEAFIDGWTEGLEGLEEMREEQIRAWRRPATHGSLQGRKVLMRFLNPGEALPPPAADADEADDGWEALKRTWRMVETDEGELERRHAEAGYPSPECVLCCVPDCAGEGVVAWADGTPAPATSLTWRPAKAARHAPGCGHLVARRAFERELE
jgi:hypothetical protein